MVRWTQHRSVIGFSKTRAAELTGHDERKMLGCCNYSRARVLGIPMLDTCMPHISPEHLKTLATADDFLLLGALRRGTLSRNDLLSGSRDFSYVFA
jgi:hypothetical protein